MDLTIKNIIGIDVRGKRVLFRPDINSPIDDKKNIVNTNRLLKTVPTLKYLLDGGAKLAIIAHQGDTLDYQNLIPLEEHAKILSELVGVKIDYIDDVCGDAAIEKIKKLNAGEAILLGNLRYLTEEISTFERDVKLTSKDMESTYLVRRLRSLFDIYVNDAFSAAHRNAPSMTGFQHLMPSFAGPLFFKEYEMLSSVIFGATKPVVYLLGGAKISDAFSMMERVLTNKSADLILASGVTGIIMLIANEISIGSKYTKWLSDRDLLSFVGEGKELLHKFKDKFVLPLDLAYEKEGKREEISVIDLPLEQLFLDIGRETISNFQSIIEKAGTVISNGPMGVYENPHFECGTREVYKSLEKTSAFTLIGGGDTVSASKKYIDTKNINYVCTAGGAMVRFLSGKSLPLIEAYKNV
ncbi:MAG: phosphoglycerate kinase [Christensenellaceae bacterium]|jgi:phosphoglycerate kinase|nr:phosphoglycerate kinase [Christensenellaceae bacterium]